MPRTSKGEKLLRLWRHSQGIDVPQRVGRVPEEAMTASEGVGTRERHRIECWGPQKGWLGTEKE